jgi:hypothetical protein
VGWFPVGDLPTNMLDRARVALRNYADGMRFSTYPAFVSAGTGGVRADESDSVTGLFGAGESYGADVVPETTGFASRNGSRSRRREACGGRVLG